MASSFADIGKSASDLLSDVFPGDNNKFETEVNAKASNGSKVQVVVARKDDALLATFKPTYPLSFGAVKGELKAQLSTDGKSKVDTSLNVSAVEGLKIKVGTTNTNVNGGFDYSSQNLNTNFKLDFPLQSAAAPTLEAASVFVQGKYSLGARFVYVLGNAGTAPEVEGKLGLNSQDSDLVLNVARNKKADVTLNLTSFHRLGENRTLGSKLEFVPGQLALANLTVATSNRINADTVVKARFNTARGALGFGVSNALNRNLTVEFGTDFRADLSAPSVYNVKLVYNN